MKLKTLVEEIEIKEYNSGVDLFLQCLSETLSEELGTQILTEDVASSCLYKDGKVGFTNEIGDNDILAVLPKIKSGDFNKSGKSFEELTATPRACIAALVAKVTSLSLGCPPQKPCNKKEDNPEVKNTIVGNVENILTTIQAKIDNLPQKVVPQKLMDMFKSAFDAIKKQPEPAQ